MHVAIIMDGNGRWALERQMARSTGHRAGARAVNVAVETAARQGVETLTLYAFSAANWQRPSGEVATLLTLFRRHLLTQTRRCLEQGIRINVIGRRDRLGATLRNAIEHSERVTAHCMKMCLRVAVDYSAQYSLMEASKRVADDPLMDQSRFAQHLADVDHSTSPAPTVDLLIRTGGEKRLSDFLLWECAYAELCFLDCWWPDFDEKTFIDSLHDYSRRDRRFGRISAVPPPRFLTAHQGFAAG